MQKQHSVLENAQIEARSVGDQKTLSGYAAIFNSDSQNLGGYIERINPGAFDLTLENIKAGRHNVHCRVQHAGGLHTVGTTENGTLQLSVDGRGLRYSATLPNTSAGNDIHELVKKGYINKSSFAFSLPTADSQSWDYSGKTPIRTLSRLDLHDVSPVDDPAYQATSVEARSAALATMTAQKRPSGIAIRAEGDKRIAELLIMDEVVPGWVASWMGGDMTSSRSIREALADAGDVDEILVKINSPGGDVFEGLTIYNTLKEHPAPVTVQVQGLAASIASVIAMAGDSITMQGGAMMMIHRAWTMAAGNTNDLRNSALTLEKIDGELVDIYAQRTKMDPTAITKMINDETWITGKEAVAMGFADRSSGEDAPLTEADGERCRKMGYRNIPKEIGGSVERRELRSLSMDDLQSILAADLERARNITA